MKSISKNYIYVGMSNNLDRRLKEHNNDERSTKAYKPFLLILSEVYDNRIIARNREKYLKSGIRKEFLKSLLK